VLEARFAWQLPAPVSLDPALVAAGAERGVTEQLIEILAGRGIRVVYGGAHVGLMGALADAVLAAGGEIIGVIPGLLVDAEVAHPGLSELRVVPGMHERKATMAGLADGFIALPGLGPAGTARQADRAAEPAGLLRRVAEVPGPRHPGAVRPPGPPGADPGPAVGGGVAGRDGRVDGAAAARRQVDRRRRLRCGPRKPSTR